MIREQMTPYPPGPWGTRILERLNHIMLGGIEQGVFPGGVVLVRHSNDVVVHEAYGHSFTHHDTHSRLSKPVPTRCATVYDLASITKLFTATCVMQLVEEQKLQLDEHMARYLPEFTVNGKVEITVRQLLAHVTGLPNFRFWEEPAARRARMECIIEAEPEFPPGTAMLYHDTNFIILGKLIEEIDGRALDSAVSARILSPLELRQSGYGPVDTTKVHVAATEDEAYVGRGMVHGEVHDENTWALGGVAGHAGLFGTARDISIFGQAYLNGGIYKGVRVLERETVTEMTRNQIGHLGSRGLGWQLEASYLGGLASSQAYGHTGFTGTSIVIDPRRELVVVLLTNRVHPTRHGANVDMVRRAVADVVLEAADTA